MAFRSRPRWNKVWGDIKSNKLRTILVILSIAIGTFAVGVIEESRIRLLEGLDQGYTAAHPFSGAISTAATSTFDDDLVEVLEDVEGVGRVEGQRSANVRLNIGPNTWENLQLRAIDDWDDIGIGKMKLERGKWPPGDKELLIERSALSDMLDFEIEIGDELLIETLDQKRRHIKVVGVVHDLTSRPTFFFGDYNGYITVDTLDWLGESREYTSLRYNVDEAHLKDKEYITEVGMRIRQKIEKSGREVAAIFIPPQPGISPIATFIVSPVIYILGALGILSVLLSGFLVTNTVSALLRQQTRQIGILKAIGGRTSQIMGIYLVLVLLLGMLSFLLAVPLSHATALVFSRFFADFLNFNALEGGLLPRVILLQATVSVGVPLIAALLPIIRGTRLSVREALGDAQPSSYGQGLLDRLMNIVRGLPRPLLLSLRNTFRQKWRLFLTLTTLTLGGAIFISVFSVRASVDNSIELLFETLIRFDVQVNLERPYRIAEVEQEAYQVEGVVGVESSGYIRARRLRADDTESNLLMFSGVPYDTPMIEPKIVAGRWLLPNDGRAMVVSTSFLMEEEDVALGDEITVTFAGRETQWKIVGVFQGLGRSLIAYANYEPFARAIRELGQARQMQIMTSHHDEAFQERVSQTLEEHFRNVGIRVSDAFTATYERTRNERQFGVITMLLLIMAVLIALVGGLGLAGTMSMNVLERTREIGVMRAIGASHWTVMRIIVVEGVLIGLMSWALGSMLSVPLSQYLCYQVGMLFAGGPLLFRFSVAGMIGWLVAVIILSTIASLVPAWNAARVTVRAVLAHDE